MDYPEFIEKEIDVPDSSFMIEIAMPRIPHEIIPPSRQFPAWQGDQKDSLVYLGWGKRDFSNESIPTHSNPGWVYWLLLDGQIQIQFMDTELLVDKGTGLLTGPSCRFGFPQQEGSACEVLVWIWRDGPDLDISACVPHWGSFSQEEMQFLQQLHLQSRLENLHRESFHNRILNHYRALVECLFLRASRRDNTVRDAGMLRAAEQWMLQHLDRQDPVRTLSAYLGISTMTLHRLFQEQKGCSPGAFFLDLRMNRATELLTIENFSVKRVAYELGYRHANDFSRAFRQRMGFSPSECQG